MSSPQCTRTGLAADPSDRAPPRGLFEPISGARGISSRLTNTTRRMSMARPKTFAGVGASLALAVAILGTVSHAVAGPNFDSESRRDMQLVGTDDLQARSSYQPTLHKYPNGRYILFVGHHALGTNPVTGLPLPSFNPLTGKNEENGTSLVDVSDPKKPTLLVHLPVPNGQGGGAQMVRVCDGRTLPIRDNKVSMLRTYADSAHEIWDVTDPSKPVGVRTVAGGNPVIGAMAGAPGALDGTHKSWWECDTGIAYVVGRRGNDTANGWRAGNHIFIFDLGNPATPVFL